ncbi:uncharacterized protein LOC142520233 [Primulina tabacum]|uniref:uncharacterized protein LOC142520233 n=1 Tax=Primulina tabacum TaxID=48773 RepID=UPI003F5AABBE
MNISDADNLWYGHLSSHIPPSSESKLRTLWHIPPSHQIIIPTSKDRPYLAPKGCYTFFQHHLDAGLRFALCDFLQELSKYYQVHLGLLTPNALRLISCFAVLFRTIDFSLNCTTFSYFLVLSRSKEGPFYVTSRSSHKLFEGAPSHVKDWKKNFFFIQPPNELTCYTDWYPTFTKPKLSKGYKKDKEYLQIMSVLGDRCFSIPQLLSEDLLCHAGLSPSKIKLKEDAGVRIMNAALLREVAKKKAGSSSSAPQKSVVPAVTMGIKGDCYAAEETKTCSCSTTAKRSASSPTDVKKKEGSSSSAPKRASSPPPRAKSPLHLVRRRRPLILAQGSGSDEGALPESGVHPLYTLDSAIVGRGPTHLAQKIMYHLPSDTDAVFMTSLWWSELTCRTCSCITEGMMYVGELVERANATRSTACQDLREGKALREQLQEHQWRTEDHAKENHRLKEELKNARVEAAQIRRDLKHAKAQHASEASSFKEKFLKSEEFNEICAPKAYHFLEVGFEGAVGLFKAQGYPPPGAPTDFIDIEGFIASLPPDS